MHARSYREEWREAIFRKDRRTMRVAGVTRDTLSSVLVGDVTRYPSHVVLTSHIVSLTAC